MKHPTTPLPAVVHAIPLLALWVFTLGVQPLDADHHVPAAKADDAGAKPKPKKPKPQAAAAADEFTAYPEEAAVTHHTVTIGDEAIHYEATAGTITLVDQKREPRARVFYIAYRKMRMAWEEYQDLVREHVEKHGDSVPPPSNYPDPHRRPLTFSFNGGPGSSSVWLHLGLFGPRRVRYADEKGSPGPPPYRVVPNGESLLDHSDFVFIDPVSTGFSRAAPGQSAKEFHGVEEDIRSVAEFIRLYLTRELRWGSPKFIAGESYGTTRAAGLAAHLFNRHGIGLNGVILVSAVLQFQTISFDTGNDLPYALFLPTYAATAHYHRQLAAAHQEKPLEEYVREVERFAIGEYASALLLGDALPGERVDGVARRVAEYSGLSEVFVRRSNLRVGMRRFAKELLRDERRTVGRFDSRFTGIDRDFAGEGYDFDPSQAAIWSIYTQSLNAYVREELRYESDLPYEILTSVWPWNFEPAATNRYLNVAERLRSVMHQQPHMRVFLASGYFDLATPHFAADYTVRHLGLAPEYRDNFETHYYEAGHMMYVHRPSLEKLREDLGAFYEAVPRGRR